MNTTPSPGPKFTLAQLLAAVTVIAVVLAIAAPWLREVPKDSFWRLVFLQVLFFVAVVPGLVIGLGRAALLSDGTKTATVFHVLSHGIGLLGSLCMMYTTLPAFEKVFRDYDWYLPYTTWLLIAISEAAVRYWFLAVPLVVWFMAVDAWLFFSGHRHEPSRGWARFWSGATTALLVGAFFFAIMALLHPLFIPYVSLSTPSYR